MQKLTKATFLDAYPMVRKIVGEYFEKQLPSCPKRATEWVERVLDYNVPGGKLKRGLTTVHAFQCLKPQATEKDTNVAVRVGWAVEILQACFLVADDIMDSSLTRRGRACWYKVPNVGMKAVNDTLLLENSVHVLVKDALPDDKLRSSILTTIAETKLNTVLGQHLDSDVIPLHACTPEHYSNVVRLKTSHYSFYLPVAVALTLASGDTADAPSELQRLCYAMGYYFQVQDDYLDCFGDSQITGKDGTDIQDGKCTWLLINALERMDRSGDDWKSLEENYGKPDSTCVNRVKSLYSKLRLERRYEEFETEEFRKLEGQIVNFPLIPLRDLFMDLLIDLHHRKK